MSLDAQSHRRFLNRYYGSSRHIYDATRKYFLFGRDTALDQLSHEYWRSLVEIGPGTGRNLRLLHEQRPEALLGGVEASDEMLSHAAPRCPWARLMHGLAESTDLPAVLGTPPDRVLFSYSLSMIQDPHGALANARRSLAPGGSVVVVDFADLSGLVEPFRTAFKLWLDSFHVAPLAGGLLEGAESIEYGPGRYYLLARFGA